MPQTQNLFPEANISKRKSAVYPPPQQSARREKIERGSKVEESVSLMLIGEVSGEPVKYFDLVTENSASESTGSEAFGKTGERIFRGVDRHKKFPYAEFHYSFPSALLMPAAAFDDRQALFAVLLDYLDLIIYIKELSENLGKLDAAIRAGKIDAVNLTARNCAVAGAHCGMFASVEILRRLERIENACQLLGAADSCRQIRRELGRFKLNLKENLEQMAAITKQERRLN